MYVKLLVMIASATLVGAGLLHLRQQRFDAMHEMASLHQQMNEDRMVLWQWQARIARAAEPPVLISAIARAQLELEPATPRRRGIVLAQVTHE
jgi:hypothetical protein